MENKAPPHNPESEQAVLGGILRVSDAYKKAQAILAPSDFYQERHRRIFASMGELHTKKEPVDLLTLQEELKRKKQLKGAGGSPTYPSS